MPRDSLAFGWTSPQLEACRLQNGFSMNISRDRILDTLRSVSCPGGGDLVSRDLVRALQIDGDVVRFVIEADSADSGEFPAGLDVWLFSPDGQVAAIPRSTTLTIGQEN